MTKVITGLVIGSSGRQAGGVVNRRDAFDVDVWNKMKPGDKMNLPAQAKIPEGIGNSSACTMNGRTEITKLGDNVGGVVIGAVIGDASSAGQVAVNQTLDNVSDHECIVGAKFDIF
jgi:hypothetical protein